MRTMRCLVAATAVSLSLLGATVLFATGNIELATQNNTRIGNRAWQSSLFPLGWRFHNPADPAISATCNYISTNAPAAALQPASDTGFGLWEADADSTLDFTFLGNSAPTLRSVALDGVNLVTFCDAGVLASELGFLAQTPTTAFTAPFTVTPGGGCPAGQGTIDPQGPPPAFCFPAGTYPAGELIDADVRFNTFGTDEQLLSTNGAAGTFDVAAIATHEIGHFFGLSHDPIVEATMHPFIDDEPPSDGLGSGVLKRADLSTAGRYYPASSYGTNLGSITGLISLDGVDADGVHVVAIDPLTMLGASGRFSLSRFEDNLALGPEGADFAANGAGFYRIDGLPPGNYYVYVEYFDNSDTFTGRLANRYNTTVGNSNVSNGNTGATGQVGAWLGFIPQLTEFYNSGDSGNGGDGVNPGTAADNSDAASLVTVVAGATTPNIDIAINIEPINGQTPANRQNPTTRSLIPNDAIQATDEITAFVLDGGDDDYYAIQFPAATLPAPPFNVAEGMWARGGRNLMPFVARLAFDDPSQPGLPDLDDPVLASAGRVLSGGPNGATTSGDFSDIRDQFNVTINEPRTVWVILNQPESPPGTTFITQGFFELVTRRASGMTRCRVCRTLLTEDAGVQWFTLNADVFYDLIVEQDPPVMITGASPNSLEEGQTADFDLLGFGFQNGAAVDLGPDVTVNSVTWISPQQLSVNATADSTGATESREINVKVINPGVVFPNVARVFTIEPTLDSDGDGTPNAQDCAPFDGTLVAPATEVQNLRVAAVAGVAEISWDSQDALTGPGTSYDVVTGLGADLSQSGGFGSATCAANDHPDSPFNDATAVGADQLRYWLVRACNSCNAGPCTYGNSTQVPDPRDALDAGAPCP